MTPSSETKRPMRASNTYEYSKCKELRVGFESPEIRALTADSECALVGTDLQYVAVTVMSKITVNLCRAVYLTNKKRRHTTIQ